MKYLIRTFSSGPTPARRTYRQLRGLGVLGDTVAPWIAMSRASCDKDEFPINLNVPSCILCSIVYESATVDAGGADGTSQVRNRPWLDRGLRLVSACACLNY